MGKFFERINQIFPRILVKNSYKIKADRPLNERLRVDHKWLNRYFDKLSDRLDNKQNLNKNYRFVHYLIVFCNFYNLLRNVVFICVSDMSSDMLYIFQDWSVFIGGYRAYYQMGYGAAFFWSTFLHSLLYLSSDNKLFVWRQLFDMCRGRLCPNVMGLNADDALVIKKKPSSSSKYSTILSITYLSFNQLNIT